MPETPKFRKQSKVRTWFNGIARETLAGDNISASALSVENQQQDSAAVRVTVEPCRGYPNLLSDKSYTELDIRQEETSGVSARNGDKMRELQQMRLETSALKRELQNIQTNKGNRVFAKTWENTAEPETHDPTAQVIARLEKPRTQDRTLNYIEMLRADVDTGRADRHTHAVLSKSEKTFDKRMREFVRNASKYDGNPKKVFEWCENLKGHLYDNAWEKIPNDHVKKMLLFCFRGSARQEIVLLQPEGQAFDNYETGEFLQSC